MLVGPAELVTVVGPGGIGKTRLAIEYALDAAPAWTDGVWMVDLAALGAGEPIGAAAAEVVGVAPGDSDPVDVVVDHLRNREALLILDNCEHVLAGARGLVRRVLANCPAVGVLTTSRERLAVDGERAVVVSPLQPRGESVDLFIDRAQRRGAALPVGADDFDLIADICERLDGLPLAIELAAARTNVLSPREILAGLGDQLGRTAAARRDGRRAAANAARSPRLELRPSRRGRASRVQATVGVCRKLRSVDGGCSRRRRRGRRRRCRGDRLVTRRQVTRSRRSARGLDALSAARNRTCGRGDIQRHRR